MSDEYSYLITHDSSLLLMLSGARRGAAVTLKCARRGKLAQLMADHVLLNKNRHMLATIVNRDGVPDHFREDGGATAPAFDDALVAVLVHRHDALHQRLIAERPFFE